MLITWYQSTWSTGFGYYDPRSAPGLQKREVQVYPGRGMETTVTYETTLDISADSAALIQLFKKAYLFIPKLASNRPALHGSTLA